MLSSSRIRRKDVSEAFFILVHSGQRDYLFKTVGLDGSIVCRAVSVHLAALSTAVYDYIPLSWVGNCRHRLHKSATFVSSVTGVYINVDRPEAEGAMVARAFSERLYLSAAILTDKSAVIFGKSFYFHSENPYKNPFYRAIIT